MKYLVKKSVLLLLVVLAFCACDNSNDNGEVIPPNPQSSKTVVNYTGEVEFVVEAPKIREDIEQDLKVTPPFGGSKKYQFIIKKHSTLAALCMLYAVNPEDDKSADGYILDIAGKVEYKDNYRLFPTASGPGWYKENIVPVDTKDGKPVATYDVFIQQNIPSSLLHSKMYFCEDLTEKYRQKFPNEDIHAVVRRLVLSYVSKGDIINE
jgi:lipoprotein